MIFSFSQVPPKIIVLHRVKDPHVPIHINKGGDGGFLIAFMNQAVNGHHPSHDKAMLLKGLLRIGRAGGIAWAAITVHGRNMVFVERDKL